jgi:hypothetical protein
MKSPFPGMDPYLEQYWLDVHARMVLYTCDQLEDQLPSSLIARVEERVVLETEAAARQIRHPDVKITERKGRKNGGVALLDMPQVAAPVVVEMEPSTETFINILEAGAKQRLVTVIEILSMTNKLAGAGQDEYRAKQTELRSGGVSLVEIDLLRQGARVLAIDRAFVPPSARTTYLACVQRGWRPGRFELYPMPLRRKLPTISIPLRKKDADIRLNLQAVLEQAYRKGRYQLTIDYRKRPNPPLSAGDAKWAKSLQDK